MATYERILGIDPSLTCTGYGVIERALGDGRVRLVEGGVIRTDRAMALPERLAQIHADLTEVIAEFQPQVAAIEEAFSRPKNPGTALLMGHARGVVLLACQQAGLEIVGYAPRAIKAAMVASGAASKAQIQERVGRMLGLGKAPEPHDVADALAAALTYCQREPAPPPPTPLPAKAWRGE